MFYVTELQPEKYYCVCSTFDDTGRVTATTVDVETSTSKPDNTYKCTRHKDIYCDWFGSREEAEEYVKTTRRA